MFGGKSTGKDSPPPLSECLKKPEGLFLEEDKSVH